MQNGEFIEMEYRFEVARGLEIRKHWEGVRGLPFRVIKMV